MTRKPNKGKREKWDVNDWRGYNYAIHFEKQAFVKAMPETVRELYKRACELLPCPKLNLWGVGEYTREQEAQIFHVNLKLNLDVWYLNPWYCTDWGWNDLQKQWRELPELYPQTWVQVPEVVPLIHRGKAKKKVVPR
jgi:hypothetical protein